MPQILHKHFNTQIKTNKKWVKRIPYNKSLKGELNITERDKGWVWRTEGKALKRLKE